jgi:glycosyltransferase involved in cell wall biosynthesis
MDLRLAGYRTGGIARYGEELAGALRRIGDISLTELRARSDQSQGPQVRQMRTPPHHQFEHRALPIELRLKGIRPDIFHAIDFVAPRLSGVCTIATVHDLEFMRHPEYLDDASLRYYRQLDRAKRWTGHWITPSRWTADDLSSTFDVPPDRISVIPHGTPADLALKSPVPRSERDTFILAVSTVEPRKRYGLLLDALAESSNPPRLIVVGKEGWNSEADVNRLSSTPGVDWRSNVSDSELWSLYRQAFAVVVPSLSEGFGMSALEAMAVGTPVVSSGHGALAEVTGLAALTPESDDPEGWEDAIERVLEDEHLWNELSAFGQRRASQFTWRNTAALTADVYRRVHDR